MIRIAAAEDRAEERARLKRYLLRYQQENDCPMEAEFYENGEALVGAYRPGTDLLLLDIEMPVLDGMRTARILREKDPEVMIVFITNLAQYAVQGYEVEALDFLVKPLEWSVFSFRMTRILNRIRRRQQEAVQSLTLRTENGSLERIAAADLLYVEVDRHTLTYHTLKGDCRVRGTMREAEQQLLPHGFCRCNQCYLINQRYVKAVHEDMVTVGNAKLKISRSRKKELIRALSEHVATG